MIHSIEDQWLRLAELQGQQLQVRKYSKKHFSKAAKAMRELTTAEPAFFVPKLIEAFAVAGVALCLVPEIPGGKISGAAKWLSTDKALTYVDVTYSDDPQEKAANQFARDLLIPPTSNQRLKSLKSRAEVVSFAKQIGISPGIVVGRLQHEKIIGYSHLNDLKKTFE